MYEYISLKILHHELEHTLISRCFRSSRNEYELENAVGSYWPHRESKRGSRVRKLRLGAIQGSRLGRFEDISRGRFLLKRRDEESADGLKDIVRLK